MDSEHRDIFSFHVPRPAACPLAIMGRPLLVAVIDKDLGYSTDINNTILSCRHALPVEFKTDAGLIFTA